MFSEGEVRPARATKKKKVVTKKRSAIEAGNDEVRISPKQVCFM